MPIPEPDLNYRTMALENALAKANADIAAKDAFIAQCADTINQQDQIINDLLQQIKDTNDTVDPE